MAAPKTMTGSRAKVYVANQLVGIYESCSYNSNIGTEPIHILGRFGPAEIVPTSYEAVTVSCTGFRVIGQGVHVLPKFPKLQDLLTLEGVTITLVDRQTGETILTVIGCVANAHSGNYNAKASSRITVSYIGMKAFDESSDQGEVNAVDLP